ncbi:MAG: PQQ-binding-like beta-propeller repeat protein [Thaumarchaeota archaeon]|nr:PQQ-binding-like beta-propeller repeat protein [Nitrososphaerota archaeon]MCL5318448.1 PQQ-binding-like beta-propeller repeat protein [Nitrososphaerota archaeon]
MLPTKSKVTILSLLVILSFSTIVPALAYAAPLANNGKDWEYVNGNSWGWNYSPQTQINKDTVKNLEVKWVFPVGSKTLAPAAIQTLALTEGAQTPPIVKNGVVYITTNFLKTYAVDAKTGKQVWTYDYTFDPKATESRLPWTFGMLGSHLHGFRYWEGGNVLLLNGMACDLYAIDAKTGKEAFRVEDLCKDVPGNLYKYRPTPTDTASVGTYEKGKQIITVVPGMMHSTTWYGDARHVTLGIDMNTKQIVWRVFSFPPQDKPTKDWALQECDIGYFESLSCKDVAAKNQAGLEWDWAMPGEKPSPYGGVTANWGQQIVDEDTGILYTNTGNQGPYTNLSLTPGPRLYGSTLMAIDLNAGKRIWWMQPFPHDPYDYDCNWGGILAEVKGLGKVYMKGCKEGYLNILDAKTGKPIQRIDVIADQIKLGQITQAAAKEPYQGGVRYHLTDPTSAYDMREWGWPDNGKYSNPNTLLYPTYLNGLFATDMSYDPDKQAVIHYANAMMSTIRTLPIVPNGNDLAGFAATGPANTTIINRDVATGKINWSYFHGTSAQRAALVVTGGMIFTGFTDGLVRFLDKDTGKLLNTVNVGTGVVVAPTIGADSDGNSKIFIIAGSTTIVGPYAAGQFGNIGPMVPGTLVALGLADKPAAGSTSVVTTATTSTVTSTSTAVSTVEVTSGLPSEVTYAAIGVAVIAIVGAAFLVMRKK